MNNWPAALQNKVNQSGFRQQFGATKIRSSNAVGPAKVRRRFTKRIDGFAVTINISGDEYDTFDNFYDTTLNGGTEKFIFRNPITNTDEEFRFVGDPSITPIGGSEFILQMTWEKLP